MANLINTTFQIRRDSHANWEKENPVLRQGEPALDLDTNELKIGDGETLWKDLKPMHSDWNEWDPKSPSYIKNRPFGPEKTEILLDKNYTIGMSEVSPEMDVVINSFIYPQNFNAILEAKIVESNKEPLNITLNGRPDEKNPDIAIYEDINKEYLTIIVDLTKVGSGGPGSMPQPDAMNIIGLTKLKGKNIVLSLYSHDLNPAPETPNDIIAENVNIAFSEDGTSNTGSRISAEINAIVAREPDLNIDIIFNEKTYLKNEVRQFQGSDLGMSGLDFIYIGNLTFLTFLTEGSGAVLPDTKEDFCILLSCNNAPIYQGIYSSKQIAPNGFYQLKININKKHLTKIPEQYQHQADMFEQSSKSASFIKNNPYKNISLPYNVQLLAYNVDNPTQNFQTSLPANFGQNLLQIIPEQKYRIKATYVKEDPNSTVQPKDLDICEEITYENCCATTITYDDGYGSRSCTFLSNLTEQELINQHLLNGQITDPEALMVNTDFAIIIINAIYDPTAMETIISIGSKYRDLQTKNLFLLELSADITNLEISETYNQIHSGSQIRYDIREGNSEALMYLTGTFNYTLECPIDLVGIPIEEITQCNIPLGSLDDDALILMMGRELGSHLFETYEISFPDIPNSPKIVGNTNFYPVYGSIGVVTLGYPAYFQGGNKLQEYLDQSLYRTVIFGLVDMFGNNGGGLTVSTAHPEIISYIKELGKTQLPEDIRINVEITRLTGSYFKQVGSLMVPTNTFELENDPEGALQKLTERNDCYITPAMTSMLVNAQAPKILQKEGFAAGLESQAIGDSIAIGNGATTSKSHQMQIFDDAVTDTEIYIGDNKFYSKGKISPYALPSSNVQTRKGGLSCQDVIETQQIKRFNLTFAVEDSRYYQQYSITPIEQQLKSLYLYTQLDEDAYSGTQVSMPSISLLAYDIVEYLDGRITLTRYAKILPLENGTLVFEDETNMIIAYPFPSSAPIDSHSSYIYLNFNSKFSYDTQNLYITVPKSKYNTLTAWNQYCITNSLQYMYKMPESYKELIIQDTILDPIIIKKGTLSNSLSALIGESSPSTHIRVNAEYTILQESDNKNTVLQNVSGAVWNLRTHFLQFSTLEQLKIQIGDNTKQFSLDNIFDNITQDFFLMPRIINDNSYPLLQEPYSYLSNYQILLPGDELHFKGNQYEIIRKSCNIEVFSFAYLKSQTGYSTPFQPISWKEKVINGIKTFQGAWYLDTQYGNYFQEAIFRDNICRAYCPGYNFKIQEQAPSEAVPSTIILFLDASTRCLTFQICPTNQSEQYHLYDFLHDFKNMYFAVQQISKSHKSFYSLNDPEQKISLWDNIRPNQSIRMSERSDNSRGFSVTIFGVEEKESIPSYKDFVSYNNITVIPLEPTPKDALLGFNLPIKNITITGNSWQDAKSRWCFTQSPSTLILNDRRYDLGSYFSRPLSDQTYIKVGRLYNSLSQIKIPRNLIAEDMFTYKQQGVFIWKINNQYVDHYIPDFSYVKYLDGFTKTDEDIYTTNKQWVWTISSVNGEVLIKTDNAQLTTPQELWPILLQHWQYDPNNLTDSLNAWKIFRSSDIDLPSSELGKVELLTKDTELIINTTSPDSKKLTISFDYPIDIKKYVDQKLQQGGSTK